MKKILVLVTNYPNNDGGVALMYVHTRNKYYAQNGIDVTVLNFAAEQGYEKDGIKVITLAEYKETQNQYDDLILHAPNIRNHYVFLKQYDKEFNHIIFFFHGHEVLMINKTYPKPYAYMKTSSWVRRKAQDFYDVFKLAIWKRYLPHISLKADFVFVSNFFYSEFKHFTGLTNDKLLNHVHIINNSVGSIFEELSYNMNADKKYDFITIRNMLDESVYCIDLLCQIAENNPDKKFLLIGKGQYFDHYKKPENIEWVDRFLRHDEVISYVDNAKCAIMLTRRDTQGVMSCELVTYGIPLITSDLPICHEIFDGIEGVIFIANEKGMINDYNRYPAQTKKITTFNAENTIRKEIDLIKKR